MFWLERRYPAEFALRVVNRQSNSQEPVLDCVSLEQLIEDIRLALQVGNERVRLPSPAPASDGASTKLMVSDSELAAGPRNAKEHCPFERVFGGPIPVGLGHVAAIRLAERLRELGGPCCNARR